MNKGPLKHLTARTQLATDSFIAKNVVDGDKTYTYRQALLDAGYSKIYIARLGPTLSNNTIVKQQIADISSKIQNRIVAKAVITKEWVINEHLEAVIRCKNKGDESNAIANIIAIGRTMGIYSDNIAISDVERVEQISGDILKEAKRISSTIVSTKLLQSPDGIPDEKTKKTILNFPVVATEK